LVALRQSERNKAIALRDSVRFHKRLQKHYNGEGKK
jgi:hypothetical protein